MRSVLIHMPKGLTVDKLNDLLYALGSYIENQEELPKNFDELYQIADDFYKQAAEKGTTHNPELFRIAVSVLDRGAQGNVLFGTEAGVPLPGALNSFNEINVPATEDFKLLDAYLAERQKRLTPQPLSVLTLSRSADLMEPGATNIPVITSFSATDEIPATERYKLMVEEKLDLMKKTATATPGSYSFPTSSRLRKWDMQVSFDPVKTTTPSVQLAIPLVGPFKKLELPQSMQDFAVSYTADCFDSFYQSSVARQSPKTAAANAPVKQKEQTDSLKKVQSKGARKY